MRKHYIVFGLSILSTICILLGCGSTLPRVYDLPVSVSEINYKFSHDLSHQKVQEKEILEKIEQFVYEGSRIRRFGQKNPADTSLVRDVEGLIFTNNIWAKMFHCHYAGGHLSVDEMNIGRGLPDTSRLTVVSLPVKYDYKTNSSFVQMTLKPSKQFSINPRKTIIGDLPPMRNLSSLAMDARRIFQHLGDTQITLNRTYNLKNEMNVEYKSDAVYANYERLLKRYRGTQASGFDIEKDNVFVLPNDGKDYYLKVSVFPYRDGSKVLYEMNIPYTLKSTGICSLSKENIENIKSKIEEIARD